GGGCGARRCDRGARCVRGARRPRPLRAAAREPIVTADPARDPPYSLADRAAHDLGPLAERVPEPLRAITAYDVPEPVRMVAKLDANELPFALPGELRSELGRTLAEVALERYPDVTARRLRRAVIAQLAAQGAAIRGDQIVFGNGSDELIAMLS